MAILKVPREIAAGKPLTAERLRQALHYDPDTGIFTSRIQRGCQRAGAIVGSDGRAAHIYICIERHRYAAHRLAWLYVHGVWPVDEIDHINGNGKDNRLSNLRAATRSQNAQNIKVRRDSRSGHKGVYFSRTNKGWVAEIKMGGRYMYLGTHSTLEAAAAVRREAEILHHGEFAYSARGSR